LVAIGFSMAGTYAMLRLVAITLEGNGILKHIQFMSRLPEKANEFTTGEKLALAAGIADAVAAFFETKSGGTSS